MEFKSPKYYAALRAERRKLQAPSRAPRGPNGELPVDYRSYKLQAPSVKHQASEASSGKPQAPSSKRQASSRKLQAP